MTRLLALAAAGLLAVSLFASEGYAQSDSRMPNRPRDRAMDRYAAPPNAPQRQQGVRVQVTGKPNFVIPFDMAADAYEVGEVHLYASSDQGRNWKLYDKQYPDAKGFKFRAPAEGEYWFAVRTVDRNGRPGSRERIQPEVKVAVDVRQPRLDMRVTVDANGRAQAQWQAKDEYLASHTFQLQYEDQYGNWQPVRVVTPSEQDKRQQWQGQAEWMVHSAANELVVRGLVMDEGKNVTRVSKRISLANVARGRDFGTRPNSLSRNRPAVGSRPDDQLRYGPANQFDGQNGFDRRPDFNNSAQSQNASRRPRDRFDVGRRPLFDDGNNFQTMPIGANSRDRYAQEDTAKIKRHSVLPQSPSTDRNAGYNYQSSRRDPNQLDTNQLNTNQLNTNQRPRTNSVVGRGWNDMKSSVGKFFGGVRHTDDSFGAAQTRPITNPTQTPDALGQHRELFRHVGSGGSRFNKTPVQGPVGERNGNGFDSLVRNADLAPQRRNDLANPNRRRPKITSSPNFEIEYDLQGVGPKGAKVVELYLSKDDGRTWHLYGQDADRKSPMEVRLKEEGLYGFRLLVHGFDAPPPQSPRDNDPADIFVAADWTKPVGRIIRAKILGGDQDRFGNRQTTPIGMQPEREMLIEWVADDALLDAQPITLSYSESPQGGWVPIAAAIDNSATYRWKLGRQVPEQVYLQLEIRDIAGNVTTSVFDAANISGSDAPGARIKSIRPIRSALRPVDMRE